MAGELSKRIGEIGEQTVIDFLTLIGWGNMVTNFDIPCSDKEKHKCDNHGIDGFFHYQSPMISNTLENVLISTKYSSKAYPSDIATKFKNDFKALTSAIECFKRSNLRNETNNNYHGINSVFDRGVIFKINNADSIDADIIDRLSAIDIPTENNHDGVILVDNGRINFLYNAISFVKNEYINNDVQFVYFNTGLNSNNQSRKSGDVLPIQYLSSDIIPFRIQSNTGLITFLICTRENFSEDEFLKLLGIAKNTGTNLQQNTVIAFPDYNQLSHEQFVKKIKLLFNDDAVFASGISAISYNPTFRR